MSRSRTLVAVLVCTLAGALAPQAQAASLGKRPLKQGMRGHDVRVLQDFLTRLGIPTYVDGHFGPATDRQVRAWETASNLRPNGRMTIPDVNRMRRQLATGVRLSAASVPAASTSPVSAGQKAVIGANGQAIAPASAPPAVKQIIAAGNRIHNLPYRYGGGHAKLNDTGYDCSGSVSFALRGAGLMSGSMASGGFASWGAPGQGRWVTIYTNPGHMYMVVAGLRFDTGGQGRGGSRWQSATRSSAGFTVRHPAGL